MSTNLFSRLRALLPAPPLLIVDVLTHNADGTSTVQLPGGAATDSTGAGVATGATFRVRGTSVAEGERAFVRAGVMESTAPTGGISEAVIGAVVGQPFGPAALAFAGPIVAPPATAGVAYALDLAPFWTGGYSPRVYTRSAGTLPSGWALTGGMLTFTQPTATTLAGLVVQVEDSTHRTVASAAFSIVVAP